MKYIKQYENNTEPQIGDYVICKDDDDDFIEINDFLSSNIGRIIEPTDSETGSWNSDKKIFIWVKFTEPYENYDEDADVITDGVRPFYKNEIIAFSPNKEDLKHIISANKYNL
jgi:hypothetical protein